MLERFQNLQEPSLSLKIIFPQQMIILLLAENSGLPQDTNYLLAVAWALQETAGQSLASLRYSRAAFQKDPTSWSASYLQAASYAVAYKLEISLYAASIARDLNPEIEAKVDENRATWMLQLNDLVGAVRVAQKAYELDTEHPGVQAIYLLCLGLQGDIPNQIRLWNTLASNDAHDRPWYSQFAQLLLGEKKDCPITSWASLGQAYRLCLTTRDKDNILDNLEKASRLVAQNEDELEQIKWQERNAWFWGSAVDQKKALELCKANIVRIRESKMILNPEARTQVLVAAMWSHAHWMVRQPEIQGLSSNVERETVRDSLERLATDARSIDNKLLNLEGRWNAQYPSFVYGRWIRDHEPDGVSWKKHFRDPLLGYLEMLDDDNPRNDIYGVCLSTRVLAMAGEADSATALLTLLLMRAESVLRNANGADFLNSDIMVEASPRPMAIDSETSQEAGDEEERKIRAKGLQLPAMGRDSASGDHGLPLNLEIDLPIDCSCCTALLHKVKEFWMCEQCADLYCEKFLPT